MRVQPYRPGPAYDPINTPVRPVFTPVIADVRERLEIAFRCPLPTRIILEEFNIRKDVTNAFRQAGYEGVFVRDEHDPNSFNLCLNVFANHRYGINRVARYTVIEPDSEKRIYRFAWWPTYRNDDWQWLRPFWESPPRMVVMQP